MTNQTFDEQLTDILDDWYPGAQYADVVPKIKAAIREHMPLRPVVYDSDEDKGYDRALDDVEKRLGL